MPAECDYQHPNASTQAWKDTHKPSIAKNLYVCVSCLHLHTADLHTKTPAQYRLLVDSPDLTGVEYPKPGSCGTYTAVRRDVRPDVRTFLFSLYKGDV